MESSRTRATTLCHMVAMPYPGRGHINPMMNLCKTLVSRTESMLITFVLTEEWFGFIGCDPKPDRIRFKTIPNVVPSELVRAKDMEEFFKAVRTKMEAPFEDLLDQLDQPPTVIMADTFLSWVPGFGNRRNIPVTSFWTMPATVFSIFHHLDLLRQRGHIFPDLLERGSERVDYIPGVSSTRLVDLPSFITSKPVSFLDAIMEMFSEVRKVQYILFPSIYELEPHSIDALRAEFTVPVYPIGPAISFMELEDDSCGNNSKNDIDYIRWLDCQPSKSVLYITMGSFLSFSIEQIDEIAAGLRESGVRYLWVARGEASRLKESAGGRGLVLQWCDQLRVLSHPSIGGFWTHCGWNSIKEGIFAGIPFLTFPIGVDQPTNSKLIVEDWMIGWRVQEEYKEPNLVTRTGIAELVGKFMDLENNKGREMRRRVKELQKVCRQAIAKDGSSETCIKSFLKDICSGNFSTS
ncbi:hypothetical protein Tsubulata_000400 [Turnera subulata]|uniref:Glycosyltransferase n=1 Tax=Turnera subulata TaxID=218843 RepID=A0A9Q0JGQ7_9ROSI|nr:hypothetical protein Tsubulata_000400 [Turnera subulata]